jgi:hypothetical protein
MYFITGYLLMARLTAGVPSVRMPKDGFAARAWRDLRGAKLDQ